MNETDVNIPEQRWSSPEWLGQPRGPPTAPEVRSLLKVVIWKIKFFADRCY